MCFLSRTDNNTISGSAPSEYRKKLGDDIEDIEEANFLPPSTWDDDFLDFVMDRSVLPTAYAEQLLASGRRLKRGKSRKNPPLALRSPRRQSRSERMARDLPECAVLACLHYCGSVAYALITSIVPSGQDQDVYLLLDQFGGRLGRAWRETDEEDTDFDTIIRDLLEGQYNNPVRVVAFNTAEGWSRDASDDVADELRERCAERGEVPASLVEFLERHDTGRPVQLALPIAL